MEKKILGIGSLRPSTVSISYTFLFVNAMVDGSANEHQPLLKVIMLPCDIKSSRSCIPLSYRGRQSLES